MESVDKELKSVQEELSEFKRRSVASDFKATSTMIINSTLILVGVSAIRPMVVGFTETLLYSLVVILSFYSFVYYLSQSIMLKRQTTRSNGGEYKKLLKKELSLRVQRGDSSEDE